MNNIVKSTTTVTLGVSSFLLFIGGGDSDVIKEFLPIIINAILAIVSIGYWISNRRESRAKVDNTKALTQKTLTETEIVLRDQIGDVIEKNVELFDKLETEREEKEKAINRISKDIRDLHADRMRLDESLAQSNKRIMVLDDEKEKYRKAYDDGLVKQAELEKKLEGLQSKIVKNSGEIDTLKKQTGDLKLPSRDGDKK